MKIASDDWFECLEENVIYRSVLINRVLVIEFMDTHEIIIIFFFF